MASKSVHAKSRRAVIYVLVAAAFAIVLAYELAGIALAKSRPVEGDRRADDAEAPSQSGTDVLGAGNRGLEKRVLSMNRRQNEMEDSLSRIEDRLAETPVASDEEQRPERSMEERQRRDIEKSENQVALVDETLEDETLDAGWSQTAVTSINTVFGEMEFLKRLNSRCQSTLCRIDMEFENEYTSGEDMQRVGANLPWNGTIFYKLEGSGKRATLYLSREGYELPRVEM